MYVVRVSTYQGKDNGRAVTTIEIDATRAMVVQPQGAGAVLSLVDADNVVVALFQDWDSCWRDDVAEIMSEPEAAAPSPREIVTSPRPDNRG